jgi:hypothetical protein
MSAVADSLTIIRIGNGRYGYGPRHHEDWRNAVCAALTGCSHGCTRTSGVSIASRRKAVIAQNDVFSTDCLQASRRIHTIGHNRPVEVTFQFLLLGCPVIELSGRYSASELMTPQPQPASSGRSFNSKSSHSNDRIQPATCQTANILTIVFTSADWLVIPARSVRIPSGCPAVQERTR